VIAEGRVPDWNRVRYEMFKRLGYFVTESSEHFSEYVPWFIKRDRPDLIEQFNIPLDEYIRRCEPRAPDRPDRRGGAARGRRQRLTRTHRSHQLRRSSAARVRLQHHPQHGDRQPR
jgi:alpha-galactosidase